MTVKRFNFPDSVPLRYDDYGTIRVTGSRVTLKVLVAKFEMGDTLEEIHEGFPSVSLSQIDAIIGWYLNNRSEADEYVREVAAEEEKILQELRSRPESIAFRERLRSRLEQMNKT